MVKFHVSDTVHVSDTESTIFICSSVQTTSEEIHNDWDNSVDSEDKHKSLVDELMAYIDASDNNAQIVNMFIFNSSKYEVL